MEIATIKELVRLNKEQSDYPKRVTKLYKNIFNKDSNVSKATRNNIIKRTLTRKNVKQINATDRIRYIVAMDRIEGERNRTLLTGAGVALAIAAGITSYYYLSDTSASN